jgi:hypothetical protein
LISKNFPVTGKSGKQISTTELHIKECVIYGRQQAGLNKMTSSKYRQMLFTLFLPGMFAPHQEELK